MIRGRLFRSWCAGAALIGLAGCRNSAGAPPANVLIITLDTTRADRLSAYGFQSASMPAIDRLAREGILFQRATTVAPLTLPAHCSLLTGLYPRHHGVRDNADPPLDPAHRTLAEILLARRCLPWVPAAHSTSLSRPVPRVLGSPICSLTGPLTTRALST